MLKLGEFENFDSQVIAAYLDRKTEWKEYHAFRHQPIRELTLEQVNQLKDMAYERWTWETDDEFDHSLMLVCERIEEEKKR